MVYKVYNSAKSWPVPLRRSFILRNLHERDGTVIIQRFAFFDPQCLRLFLKILVKYMNQTYINPI